MAERRGVTARTLILAVLATAVVVAGAMAAVIYIDRELLPSRSTTFQQEPTPFVAWDGTWTPEAGVGLLGVFAAVAAIFFAYRVADRQRQLSEQLTQIEQDRQREEERARWLSLEPLPLIYRPSSGVDGWTIRVRNIGGADALVNLRFEFLPPGDEGRYSVDVAPAQQIPANGSMEFDATRVMNEFSSSEYLRWHEDDGPTRYARLVASVADGPVVVTCMYCTEHGVWVQAEWEIEKVSDGSRKVIPRLSPEWEQRATLR